MKIAILGGGLTGLTAAYKLCNKGHKITIFEKEKVLGGLASGFKGEGWDWYLERTYHHLFSNDRDILDFAKEIGFEDIVYRSPETASLCGIGTPGPVSQQPILDNTTRMGSRFEPPSLRTHNSQLITNNYRIIPVDTPQDFLKFPFLSFPEKIRSAIVLAFLKFSPFLSYYERVTAEEFLTKFQGERAWKVLWQELFRKKFGKYAGNIVASFFWARITKRTKSLGYVEGGFQTLIDFIGGKIGERGGIIKKGVQIREVGVHGSQFTVDGETYDAIISTLPTPVLTRLTRDVFPEDYLARLNKIKYLNAVNLILETEKPILDKTYWLSVCTPDLPMMVVVQHTNFMDKSHYNNHSITYIGDYIDNDSPLIKMSDKEILKHYLPHLKKITMNHKLSTLNHFVFKAPFAQPIFNREFVKVKPDFETPVKNFFIANLDMTYPYDRGTNYAVKLGRKVSALL